MSKPSRLRLWALPAVLLAAAAPVPAAELLVEAESFADHGGWVLDPQFADVMGSSYLLAHGLGKPVADARTEVTFAEAGEYHLWVRAKDWVPSHHPGRFKVIVNGKPLAESFGTNSQDWSWQSGGTVTLAAGKATVGLQDLTGFDGRCDAIYFTTDKDAVPPAKADAAMASWRRMLLRLPDKPTSASEFDVVVVGGGVAGCCAALTAARLGLKVALVHDRPVIGGNASSEIGLPPAWGPQQSIVMEVLGQIKTTRPFTNEPNLSLHMGWRAFGVETNGKSIASVKTRDIRTNEERRFIAPVFIDCTGDGWVGFWAGADYRIGREGYKELGEPLAPNEPDKRTHGNTVVFRVRQAREVVTFPDVPWATEVSRDYADLGNKPEHFWEAGQGRDTLAEAEWTRDHLLCAIYGTMATVKKNDPEKNGKLEFEYVSYIIARGESRRLMGDYLLTQHDLGRRFHDVVALAQGWVCLHYQDPVYDFRASDSIRNGKARPAVETEGRKEVTLPASTPEKLPAELETAARGRHVPFRCLYSRNVENLMMAGRDVSATHVALMGVKAMRAGGSMGIATGAAAHLCKKYGVGPRGVYETHLAELQQIAFGIGKQKDALKPGGKVSDDEPE